MKAVPVPTGAAFFISSPLIDVLLVLLVIFMAALPLTQKALESELPRQTQATTDPIGVSIVLEYTADGIITVNKDPVGLPKLENKLRTIFEARQDRTMYVIGASTLRYRDVVAAIDAAKGASVEGVGIVTEGMRRSAGVPLSN